MDDHPDEYQATPQSKSAKDSLALTPWFVKPKSVLLSLIGLFLVFSGIAFFLGYKSLDSVREKIKAEDIAAATLLAEVLNGREQGTIAILQSYASRPLFVDAVKTKNVPRALRHLKDLRNHHEIDLPFVTDPQGILWLNYPFSPEAVGKDLSKRDWHRGVSAQWQPHISGVFQLIVADKPLAVSVCVPILDEKEKVIGVLASSQRLADLAGAIERVTFRPRATFTVIDREGNILYSNRYAYRKTITKYQHSPMLDRTGKGKRQWIEDSRHRDLGTLYLTAVPVGDSGWSVVIERKRDDIYRAEFRRFAEIGGAALALFALSGLVLLHMRKVTQFRQTQERLDAQQVIAESEERFRNLFNNALEGVYRSTPEGRLITVNRAFADMFGYETPEEMVKTISDIGKQMYADPGDRERVIGTLRGMGYIKDLECRMSRKDGSTFWAHFNGRLSKSSDGAERVDGFVLDITERKRAAENLKKLNAELEQRVSERTAELAAKAAELERVNKVFVGRELRMRELKERIAELEKKTGAFK